jgi:cardiolipin synthase
MTTSQLWVLTALLVQAAGVLHAAHAVFRARSPQAAIAWSVSLVTMPWLAIPFYWVFGRNRFRGYVISRRAGADITVESWQMITAAMGSHRAEQDGGQPNG